MPPRALYLLLVAILVGGVPSSAVGQVVLETDHLRLEIGSDGTIESLRAKATGVEYACPGEPAPAALVYRGGSAAAGSQEDFAENQAPVYRGGEAYPATAASLVGDRLTIQFAAARVTATYQVTRRPEYVALRLMGLEGDPIDRIDLLRLRVKRLPHLGPWIDVACDDRFGICLCAGNIQTNAGMSVEPSQVDMMAVAEKEVALEGTTAVLFGCVNPRDTFLDVMEVVERDFHMPAGVKNRRAPVQRHSYLWAKPTPENVDGLIGLAKRAGLRAILYSYTSFSKGAEHFVWNDHYPQGMADLKKVSDAIRAAEFMRINFGWIFRLYPEMGPDVLEYVLSRGAGWDCPISIIMDPQQVAAHPRGEDCLDVIRTWENARIEGRLTPEQQAMLRTLDPREHRFIKTWHAVFLDPVVKSAHACHWRRRGAAQRFPSVRGGIWYSAG